MYNLSFIKHHLNNDPFIYYCHLNDKPKDSDDNFIKYTSNDKKIIKDKTKKYLKENYSFFDCENTNINVHSLLRTESYDILWMPRIVKYSYYFDNFFIAKKSVFFKDTEEDIYICVVLGSSIENDKILVNDYFKFLYAYFYNDNVSNIFYKTIIQEHYFNHNSWYNQEINKNLDDIQNHFNRISEIICKSKNLIPGKNIFPNMKNNEDYPYHSYKKQIAKEINEITQYYYCTVKNRDFYNKNNRYKPYTLKNLGFNNKISYRNNTIDKLLKGVNSISNKALNELKTQFKYKQHLFYLDIEQIPNIIRDYSEFPYISSNSIIYNIGVVYQNISTKETEFKSFFTNNLDDFYEENLIYKLRDYIDSKTNGGQNYSIIHWGKAEVNFMKLVENKKGRILFDYTLFFDLCDFFIKNQIIFPNMKNFKLKEVANCNEVFKKDNNLKTEIFYNKNELIINKNRYSQSKLLNVSDGMETIGLFLLNKQNTVLHESIMYYNQKDCEYLYNILNHFIFFYF